MARESVLGNVINVFERLGVYEVVLPYLLVFTVVFAILEKTRILGEERYGEGKHQVYTKKSLNAMVAFVTAFFVIASAQLVEVVTKVSAQMVILLLLAVFFLMLVGTFKKPGKTEEDEDVKQWAKRFTYIMFIGIIVIFLNAIPYSSNQTWLEYIFTYLQTYGTSSAVASIILIVLLIVFVYYVTLEGNGEEKAAKEEA
ncbi:MAG: hypothetical protein ACE5FT_02825 [Candidatus Nanoarchaeia archaeon]